MPSFKYKASTIIVREMLVRDRELIRRIVGQLSRETNSDITAIGLNEFAAAVVLTDSGDEEVWKRPSAHGSTAELLDGLEAWGELRTPYVDKLMSAIYGAADEADEKN